ncbi:hypothetical protein ACFSYB_22455 [Litchfieldia salsa]
MMYGEGYKRAFNNDTNKIFLEIIRTDFGDDAFISVLDAVQEHIDY